MKKDKLVSPKKFVISFLISTLSVILLVIFIVVLFDPFYNYHKPLPGLKAVLNDKEYQCIGTLRHFDYDSLIVGSSVCENYDNRWFDEGFDCKSIKAIRSYGATADLCYLLDIAYENHDLKYVFYNIDPSSLSANVTPTYVSTGCPVYLYDKNYLNDFKYLLNKDVLFEKIPHMLANSFIGDYEEGNSYNWAQWKFFNSIICRDLYDRPNEIVPMNDIHTYNEELNGNIQLLTNMVSSHPDTTFKFFFSPYSMLWWDNSYRTGDRDAVLYNETECIKALLAYKNVEIYFYQDDKEIVTNLENYMDTIHFSKEVNQIISDKLIHNIDPITFDNYEKVMSGMYQLSEDIVNNYILEYYDN